MRDEALVGSRQKAAVGVLFCLVLAIVFRAVSSSGREDERKAGTAMAGTSAKATFAGGCFWCMQPVYDKVEGVLLTTVGYTGGTKPDPTYEEVSAGGTGHAEAIQIEYDPLRVSYEKLLDLFWRNIDPTTKDRQFCDVGRQYRSAIFAHDETQLLAAERSRAEIERTKTLLAPIVTEIVPAGTFYPAEDYHQSFYEKNPIRYYAYRKGCGRDRRIEELWGKPGAP